MKNSVLVLLLCLYSCLLPAQQDSVKKDARYKNIINPCSIIFKSSSLLQPGTKDSVHTYTSDSGFLYMDDWLSEMPLKAYLNYFDSYETPYRTDSVFSLLFRYNFLTYDNIIPALKMERKSVSQYGDTLDFSLTYAPGPISVFRLNTCPVPKYIKDGSLCFDIGFVQDNAPELRYHFKLLLYTPKKCRKTDLYQQIQKSVLKCLLYQGFEV